VTLQPPQDGDAAEEVAAPELTIVAGSPTPAELAAITAVITGMLAEIANDERAVPPMVSAWQRSQRSIRRPLTPGPGAWRSFSGA
jgi:hypothetical protein